MTALFRRFLFILCLPTPAFAATFTVGTDPACTHATLAAAINAAAMNGPESDEIRVIYTAMPAVFTQPLSITGQSVQIRGGFFACDSAAPSPVRTEYSLPLGDGILVDGEAGPAQSVSIAGIDLIGGMNSGRLLDIAGNVAVTLEQTWLTQGHAVDGAGARLSGGGASLTLGPRADIHLNVASGNGGGISCTNGATLTLLEGAAVDANSAGGDGGGIYASACTLAINSGDRYTPLALQVGITGNGTAGKGGGIAAVAGANVSIGAPPNIIGPLGTKNLTRIGSNQAAVGGGIYAEGQGTTVEIVNARVDQNTASVRGGGYAVTDHAELAMGRFSVECPLQEFCSEFNQNTATANAFGGGVAADGGAQVSILQTYISGNQAGSGGSIVDARGADTLVLIEGAMLYDNGPRPATYADTGAWVRAAYVSTYAHPGGAFALGDDGRTSVYSSVIQDTVFVLPQNGTTTRFADCSTVKEADSIPPDLDLIEVRDDPAALFRNPAAGDLRPPPHAPSIDRCDSFFYSPTTLDVFGFARGFDVPSESNSPSFGSIDQGAVEASWLFADNFDG